MVGALQLRRRHFLGGDPVGFHESRDVLSVFLGLLIPVGRPASWQGRLGRRGRPRPR